MSPHRDRPGPPLPRVAFVFLPVALLTLLPALTHSALPPPTSPPAASGPAASASASPASAPVVHGHTLAHRWVYIQNNFQVQSNVERVNGILDRAKAAGYNGAVFADVKFGRLDDGSLIPAYYSNLRAVLDHARALDFEVYPATADFGYSSALLWHDPNLAEGLPVRDAPFLATGGRLVPREDPPLQLANADFEALPAAGHQFPGWAFQDAPGQATFVDREVKHGGRASLRMVDLGTNNPPAGNGRVYQRLAVRPFQVYHLSVWVKTQDFRGGEVRALVLAQNPSRTLQWNAIAVQPTQDWQRFDVTFNTLTHTEVLLYFGVWSGGSGTIWWDDGGLEPAGLVNLVRRPGAPVQIESADGAMTFAEGQDVEPLVDPKAGTVPYNGEFDLWHAPPEIRLAPGSRIREGDVVRLSFYHAALIYGDQVAASLTEPKVFEIVEGQMRSLAREFGTADVFSGWMFSHDEIRVHGWDEAPKAGGGTPGEDLAFNFRTLADRARAIDPAGKVLAWSDMFDPHHNAAVRKDPYYLVDGDWSGSWEGVPAEVLILNWNQQAGIRRDSAAFFAGRGHPQILAGYYDAAPARFGDRAWLADLAGLPGISGVMYTQWGSGYANLEAWAEHVWGGADWVTPTPGAGGGTATAAATRTGTATGSATSLPATATVTATPTPGGARGRVLLPFGEKR